MISRSTAKGLVDIACVLKHETHKAYLLDECAVVPVCDGEWRLEEAHENGAQLWRFWRDPEADQ